MEQWEFKEREVFNGKEYIKYNANVVFQCIDRYAEDSTKENSKF